MLWIQDRSRQTWTSGTTEEQKKAYNNWRAADTRPCFAVRFVKPLATLAKGIFVYVCVEENKNCIRAFSIAYQPSCIHDENTNFIKNINYL